MPPPTHLQPLPPAGGGEDEGGCPGAPSSLCARQRTLYRTDIRLMFTFILVVQAIVAALLVTVILMQKSEGGGLGVGGSPAGFMSARGAADFLTRSTTVLAGIFVTLSVVLAVIASIQHRPSDIDTSLVQQAPAAPASGPAPATGNDPLAGPAGAARGNAANGEIGRVT